MKKLIFLLFLFTLQVSAQNEVLFEEGNMAYNEGDYSTAISNYEQILENGQTSSALYFNLANAHFKINNIAPSIYYYEKALQLDPNDSDIKTNLEIARTMVIDDIQDQQITGFTRLWNNSLSILGYNQWGWMAVTFSVLFAVLFLLYYFSRKSLWKRVFFPAAGLVFFLMIISIIFAFQQQNYYTNNQFAIIYAQQVVVRSEPTPRADEVFVLHEGTKIEILETYQDWVRFELANGAQGWMEKDYIKIF